MKHLSKLLIILLLSSCASTKILDLGGKVSTLGTEVSQKAIDVFTLLSQQADIDKSQQDKVKVLTNPNPVNMPLPNTKVADFSKQLASRIKAYQSLMYLYKIFGLLTEGNYSDKTKEAMSALKDSYNSLGELPDIPPNVSSKLPEVSKMLTQVIQAKKVHAHNKILFNLTQLYVSLWNVDQNIWNDYLDRIYGDYALGLNTVDEKKYDVKKISENSKDPYSDESIIILMYKLEKRDEIIKQKNAIKKQLSDFGKALNELNKAHGEISKGNTDISDVIKTLNSIDTLIKN